MNTLYFVHCVDTEGPLMEDFDVPFQLVKRIFNIDIEPTRENLRKLRNKEIDLGGLEDAVASTVDPRKSTLGTWTEIDRMLDTVTSAEYRNLLKDSAGEGWKFTWCCLNHTGFTGVNPRHRDAGYNNVYDHYRHLVDTQKLGDAIGFHYHPVSLSGNFNDSGTAYWGGENLNKIFAHAIIDRMWFPTVFRPGFNTERPDSNWFLEQWIPFDYANNAMNRANSDQPDLTDGRFGDWRRAPAEWRPYHPSHDDYQTEGGCRRYIMRTMNMYARLCQIEIEDIREGFERARNVGDTVIAVADHDYKDMIFDIDRVREMLREVSAEYPDVEFRFCDGITAMRNVLGLPARGCELRMEIDRGGIYPKLVVTSDGNIFGPQPFLAIKTYGNAYHWDNFDFYKKNCWTYTFDSNTVPLEQVDKIGVASNSFAGVSEVLLYDGRTEKIDKKIWNI